MKVLTWNLRQGGLKVHQGNIVANLRHHDPEIVVLTEYREGHSKPIREGLEDGWRFQLSSSRNDRENSILVAGKAEINPSSHYPDRPQASHRWLECKWRDIVILAVHVPGFNDKWGKEDFWKHVVAFGRENLDERAMIIGDFNTGLAMDAEGTPFLLFEYMEELIELGWTDAWRSRNPGKREFTWNSPNAGNGFRLDYAFLSSPLEDSLIDVHHSHEEREKGWSDHSSLIVELDI